MTVKALTLSRIVPVCMAGAMLMACNRDEIIESVPAPRIVLDNGSGVYTVRAGDTLTKPRSMNMPTTPPTAGFSTDVKYRHRHN